LAGYLAKPVRKARLHQAIRRALGLEPPESLAPELPREGKRGRILVVDDHEGNRKVALLQLKGLGFSAVAANSAAEALDRLAVERFDAVLMDCEMPEMDGFEAARRIRGREAPGIHQPIIALTAHVSGGVEERCRAAGMDAYLPKPLRMESLAELLGRWALGAVPDPQPARLPDGEAVASSVLDGKTWEGLKHLETLTGPGAIADLVEAFLTDAPVRLLRLEQAIASGDEATASRDAHDLKANAATLGALRLAGVMAEIEAATRGESSLDLTRALARARALFGEAQAALADRRT